MERGSVPSLQAPSRTSITSCWCTENPLVHHHLSLEQATKWKAWSGGFGATQPRVWSTRSHPGALLIPCLHLGKPGAAKGWLRAFRGKQGLVTDPADFNDFPSF